MDRIDLYADVQEIEHAKLLSPEQNNSDESIRRRVIQARDWQQKRFTSPTKLNADMDNDDIKRKSNLTADAKSILDQAATAMGLSARSYMRVIKVARTIADLCGSEKITTEHITEALQYRNQSAQQLP